MIKLIDYTKKKEYRWISAFAGFYSKRCGYDINPVGIDESEVKMPDFYLPETKTLVEISEIHDREELEVSAKWGKIIYKLQKSVDSLIKDNVRGTYLISTPWDLRFPTEKNKYDEAARIILKSVIGGKKELMIFKQTFRIEKISTKGNGIYFSSHGGGRSYNPAETIHQNIRNKLRNANQQLSLKSEELIVEKKILLLVNKYPLVSFDWDLFEAVSKSYENLREYTEIDDLWYQNEIKGGGYIHKLLYSREFFGLLEKKDFKKVDQDQIELFENWFSQLANKGDEKKLKLLSALRVFLKNKQGDEVFENSLSRGQMVKLGEWLLEKGKNEDAIWLVSKFINDRDPANPEDHDIKKEELHYHNQIKKGDSDVFAISGVLAHLAWVIQKMSFEKQLIGESLKYTKMLLEHNNLYVKLQGIIPLIEIAKRREWLKEYDSGHKTELFREFRDVVFDLLRNYSKYPAISKWLVHIFNYYRDINTDEALLVLGKLSNTSESAALFIIFGVFRERYKTEVEYDGKKVEKKLIETIVDSDSKYVDLRANIAWNFWKLLKEEPDKFDEIKKYIDLFFNQPYSKGVYASLERVIEDWLDERTKITLKWFDLYVERLSEYLEKSEKDGRSIWITPEKMINKLAQENPKRGMEVMRKLFKIWKSGAYIGNIDELFKSYKNVKSRTERSLVKKELKKMYATMKKMNPKLQEVNFE